MHRALSQSELLELILLSLDLQILLTSAQRVCSQWRHIIRDPPSCRGPYSSSPVERPCHTRPQETKNTLNSLLTTAFPGICHSFSIRDLDLISHPSKRTAYLRSEASWRSMLLQQPPAAASSLLRHPATLTPKTSYPLHKEGLRMETLFELLFFDHDLTEVNYPHRLVWWGQCSETAFCDGLKSFGRIELPDVLVCACRSHTCTDMDSDFENEDQDVVDAVHAEYRELGQKRKVLGPERKRTKLEYSGAWD
ncbi:hypothetical protein BDV23DRAFT_195998 [Aspergillus alliaceus]|uniref:F-box domain-containing protein n=1 Tax=Petromyces alliaceus TaxID=209559 RepID=A0A5N7BZ13_PETAA|nr:hypothetical protein BDV23DRAFT_195998 [Aspergillus alliaceus]